MNEEKKEIEKTVEVNTLGLVRATPFSERPWNNANAVSDSELKKRSKGKKPIIHPLFNVFAELCVEEQWNSLFSQCAIGNFPRGFLYKDTALQFKHKKKTETIMLFDKSDGDALQICISFFKEHRGYWAKDRNDEKDPTNILNIGVSMEIYTQWSHIKRKHIRENYISFFLSELKEKYALTNLEFLQLKKIICIGTIKNYMNQHNIHLEENQISTIYGLEFDETNRLFYFDESKMKKISRSSSKRYKDQPINKNESGQTALKFRKKIKIINYETQWVKYIDSFMSMGHKNTTASDATVDDTNAETEL